MDDNGEIVNKMMEAHAEVARLRTENQALKETIAWYERQMGYIKLLVDMSPK